MADFHPIHATEADARKLAAAARYVASLPRGETQTQPPGSQLNRPPIVAVLLEDCPPGAIVLAEVLTQERWRDRGDGVQVPRQVIDVCVYGSPDDENPGTLAITWDDETSDAWPITAGAEEVQAAVASLPALQALRPIVTLGTATSTDPRTGVEILHQLMRWRVSIDGQPDGSEWLLAPPTINDADAPQPIVAPVITGLVGVCTALTLPCHWVGTGNQEQVQAAVPVGDPTALRIGAQVFCQWVHGAGYCITAAEGRKLNRESSAYAYV